MSTAGEQDGDRRISVPWDVMHSRFRGEVIYQAKTDIHFPQLAVGQTLRFAALGRTPKNRLPGVSRQEYARHVRDAVMAVFRISHTINTKVGDDYVRGVSGGERKRVSIAEVMLSQSSIQCWDNSTRGLDSATALEFARTLRLSSELMGTTAIVAMYQASQPAYDVSTPIPGTSPRRPYSPVFADIRQSDHLVRGQTDLFRPQE